MPLTSVLAWRHCTIGNQFPYWLNIMKQTSRITFAAMAAILLASGASAATMKPFGASQRTCAVADVTIGGNDASKCVGAFGKTGKGGKPANDSNSDLDGLFDIVGWNKIVKVEERGSSGTGNGVTLTLTDNGSRSGNWSVDDWGGFTTVMAVLKGGPSFSAYLLDTTAGIAGTWTTDGILTGGGPQRPVGIIGNNQRKQRATTPGLSHMTLYSFGGSTAGAVSNEITGPAAVPLPAAGWLLLAGLGGLAALRRRKSL
jgi:hypothetical protein